AAAYRVPLTVRSAFDESPGTEITEIMEEVMEGARVEAVTHRDGCSIAIAEGNAGGRGEARGLIEAVSERFPDFELIAHEQASEAAQGERALEKRQVPLLALRVTPVALVFRVPGERCQDAVKALHAEFLERVTAAART